MTNKTLEIKKTAQFSPQMLRLILEEVRLLRKELMFLFPQEDLEDYEHPARIHRSYQKATKEYPPISLWR